VTFARTSIDDLEPIMRQVVVALDALADAVRGDQHLPSELVQLSEVVSAARAVLYAELTRQGWVAPTSVPDDVHLDQRLRVEGLGSGYDAKSEPV
jgi:hypothetical protein